MYFETKTTGLASNEEGELKNLSIESLVSAESHSDGDMLAIKIANDNYQGSYRVDSVKRSKVIEILAVEPNERKTVWYAVIQIKKEVAETGRIKTENYTICVIAGDKDDSALKTLKDGMKGTLSDYSVTKLTKKKFKYVKEDFIGKGEGEFLFEDND